MRYQILANWVLFFHLFASNMAELSQMLSFPVSLNLAPNLYGLVMKSKVSKVTPLFTIFDIDNPERIDIFHLKTESRLPNIA